MLGRGAAAAADESRPAIARHDGVVGHQFGRAVVMDVAIDIFRDAGIALGDDRQAAPGGGEPSNGAQQVRRADAAIRAKGQRPRVQRVDHRHHVGRGQPHHRPARGVEAHRADPGNAGPRAGFGRGAVFLGRADRLDPQHVGAALLQPLGLFVKHLDRKGVGQGAHRGHDLSGRTHRPGHDHRPIGPVGHLATDFGGGPVELTHAPLGIVQLQPRRIRPEGVCQKQIAARLDRTGIERDDLRGRVGVPQLRRVARLQPHVEQVGAGRAIGEDPVALGQKP
jgi:hypothetical protein